MDVGIGDHFETVWNGAELRRLIDATYPAGRLGEESHDDPLGFAKPPARPVGHLANAIFDAHWGVTAARWEAWKAVPETVAANAEVDRQRRLWSTVDSARRMIEFYHEGLTEPSATEAGRAKLSRRITQQEAKLGIALGGGAPRRHRYRRVPTFARDAARLATSARRLAASASATR